MITDSHLLWETNSKQIWDTIPGREQSLGVTCMVVWMLITSVLAKFCKQCYHVRPIIVL